MQNAGDNIHEASRGERGAVGHWRSRRIFGLLGRFSALSLLSQQTHGQAPSKTASQTKACVLKPTSTVMDEVHTWINSVSSFSGVFEAPECELSPRSSLKRTRRSPNPHRRVRPRLDSSARSSAQDSFEMDSTTDASSVTSLDSRRKLKPTSPLMKRKSSQSPERTQRVLLEQGKPPIRIRQPDSTSRIVSSEELQGILSENFSDNFVPTYLKVCYDVSSPASMR